MDAKDVAEVSFIQAIESMSADFITANDLQSSLSGAPGVYTRHSTKTELDSINAKFSARELADVVFAAQISDPEYGLNTAVSRTSDNLHSVITTIRVGMEKGLISSPARSEYVVRAKDYFNNPQIISWVMGVGSKRMLIIAFMKKLPSGTGGYTFGVETFVIAEEILRNNQSWSDVSWAPFLVAEMRHLKGIALDDEQQDFVESVQEYIWFDKGTMHHDNSFNRSNEEYAERYGIPATGRQWGKTHRHGIYSSGMIVDDEAAKQAIKTLDKTTQEFLRDKNELERMSKAGSGLAMAALEVINKKEKK